MHAHETCFEMNFFETKVTRRIFGRDSQKMSSVTIGQTFEYDPLGVVQHRGLGRIAVKLMYSRESERPIE